MARAWLIVLTFGAFAWIELSERMRAKRVTSSSAAREKARRERQKAMQQGSRPRRRVGRPSGAAGLSRERVRGSSARR